MKNKHTVNSYDHELSKLRNSVINMANLVKDLIHIATSAIQNQDQSYVELVNSTDKKINEFDREIESLAIHVIALRQPMAVDLRQVIAALKLAVILERMGDLSKKISHRFEYLPIDLDPKLIDSISKMTLKVKSSLSDIIIAYEKLDDKLATKVCKEDHKIDKYYLNIMTLLEKEIENNPKESKYFLNVMVVIRNLERLGDYITKVSYIIHYIVTGNKKVDQ